MICISTLSTTLCMWETEGERAGTGPRHRSWCWALVTMSGWWCWALDPVHAWWYEASFTIHVCWCGALFTVCVVVVLGAHCHSCVVLGIHRRSWVLLLGPRHLSYVVVWDLVRHSCGGGARCSLCGAGSSSPFVGDGAEPSCMVVWGHSSVVVLGHHCHEWWCWGLVAIRAWWCGASLAIHAWCCWVFVAIHQWWCWALVHGGMGLFIGGGTGPSLLFIGGGAVLLLFMVRGPHRCLWVVELGPQMVIVLGPHVWWYGALFAVCRWWY